MEVSSKVSMALSRAALISAPFVVDAVVTASEIGDAVSRVSGDSGVVGIPGAAEDEEEEFSTSPKVASSSVERHRCHEASDQCFLPFLAAGLWRRRGGILSGILSGILCSGSIGMETNRRKAREEG